MLIIVLLSTLIISSHVFSEKALPYWKESNAFFGKIRFAGLYNSKRAVCMIGSCKLLGQTLKILFGQTLKLLFDHENF